MSWRATAWASDQVTGSPISKAVLWKLADNANDQGRCWPSVPLIAAHTELSERTVQMHLGRLEALGLVTIERRTGDRGEPLPSIFQLNMPACQPSRAKASKPIRGGGAADSPPPHAVHQGGAGDSPGGESDDIPYKEEPSTEPSIEPLSNAPACAGEREGGKVASLGKEDLAHWPAFRTAVAETWPDGFPETDERSCKAEFGKLTRTVSGDQLVDFGRLHGQFLQGRAKGRSKAAGKLLVQSPSAWLRSGGWQGYVSAAEVARKAEAQVTSALGRVQRGLGPELFDWLRHDKGMSDASLAALDGAAFETGPDPVILVTSSAARILLDRYLFAMQRKFGEGLRIQQVTNARTA